MNLWLYFAPILFFYLTFAFACLFLLGFESLLIFVNLVPIPITSFSIQQFSLPLHIFWKYLQFAKSENVYLIAR